MGLLKDCVMVPRVKGWELCAQQSNSATNFEPDSHAAHIPLANLHARLPLPSLPPHSYNLFVEMTAQIRRNVIYNVYMFK